ncbi:MAG: beta family protein [Thermodesulfobacteriota bacterium]
MINHLQYVPILRWKKGEKIALRELYPHQKSHITPLIEFMPNNFVLQNKVIDMKATSERFAEEVNDYWGTDSIFLDFENITQMSQSNLAAQILRKISGCWLKLNLDIIPVTTFHRQQSYQDLVKYLVDQNNIDICLRLNYRSILSSNFRTDLDLLLDYLKITPEKTHLIIDYKIIGNNSDIFSNISTLIPNKASWKSFIFASGAFPENLSGFLPGQHFIKRNDWIYWFENMFIIKSERTPTYCDYTIQYPQYIEPPKYSNPSASIRYTSHDYWVIMRGEGLNNRSGSGYAQYPANAQLLMSLPEFCGAKFSDGDKYIFDKGSNLNTPKTGNPETWIRAGINHHIAFVVDQLSNLTGL